MNETLSGFQGGLQIGGRIVMNFCYADDIILLAFRGRTTIAGGHLDRVSHRYSLLVNVNKTKVMVSDGIPVIWVPDY